MASQTQIPFVFGPSGGRSINSILFGSTPLDLKSLVTGVPTYKTPADFTAARNLEVLTTLDVKNLQINPTVPTYDTQKIGLAFGVPQSVIDQAAQAASLRLGQINKGARIDSMVNTAIDAGLATIAAAWAFLGAQAVAPLYTSAATLPAGVEGPVAPLTATETTINYGVSGVTTSAYGVAVGQAAKVAIDIFGVKIGSALTALLTGNFGQAAEIIFSQPPSPPTQTQGFFSSGGGGGSGLGINAQGNTGQTNSNVLVYSLLGIGLLVSAFLIMRKRG